MTRFYQLAMPNLAITTSANTARTLCDRLSRSDQVAEHHKGGITENVSGLNALLFDGISKQLT